MADGTTLLSYHVDGVAWITIDRPDRRNAIDQPTRALLGRAFADAIDDTDVRVVVLTGSGSSFCAGVDLADVSEPEGHVLARHPEPLATPVLTCPKPVVAAVNGPAVGGGFELALAADCRIASREAFFALPEVRIGSMPGSGGTQRLFSALPSAVAWELLFTGARLDAHRAHDLGLVSSLHDAGDLMARAGDLASAIAANAPLSLRAIKRAGRAALEAGAGAGLDLERSLWAFLSTTEDRAEGRAAFREKRAPDFRGR